MNQNALLIGQRGTFHRPYDLGADPEKLRQQANEIEKERKRVKKREKRSLKEERQIHDARDVLHTVATNPKSSDEDRVEAARVLLGSY